MKNCLLLGVSVLTCASFLVSCSDEWGGNAAKGNGCITPLVQLDASTITSSNADAQSAVAKSRAADQPASAITASDLSLRLTKADGTGAWEFESVADFPTDRQFAVGQYELEAFYGDVTEQGFDCPSYYGSQTITVEDSKTTTASITATMSKSMVTIKYTDAFMNYMDDWSAEVNGIEYIKEEERPVYVTPGDVTIRISVTKPNGLSATFTLDPVTAEARHHYVVKVNVNNGAVGDAVLTVSFDDTLIAEDVEIDLSDKLLSTPAPETTAVGFDPETPVEVVSGLPFDGHLSMNLVALAGLKEVNLTTNSPSLLAQGWPEQMNLMAADADLQARLTSLGLGVLGLWKIPGEMAVVDFSNVAKSLKAVAGEDNINTFTLTVKDKLMRESDPLTLSFDVENVTLELAAASEYFAPGEEVSVTLGYNGVGVKENVQMQYKNPVVNTWRNLEVVSVSEPRSRTMSDYTVVVKAPADLTDNLVMRAVMGTVTSNETTVKIYPIMVQFNQNDVFANRAYFKVLGTAGQPAPALDQLTVNLKENGSNVTPEIETEDGYFKLVNLKAATPYVLSVEKDGVAFPEINFTTEAATALENGDMENWSSTQITNAAMKCDVYTCEGWATLNPLTTSKLSAGTNYSALSSTLPDNEGNNGKAALLRSVGFDMSAASALLNNPKQYSLGELFLGTYDNGANYGIDFASRPSKLTFAYKYTPQNSADKGYAEITVLDGNGAVISTATADLAASGSYSTVTLALDYPKGSAKAAKLQVIFRSSNAGDTFLNSTDVPKHANGWGILNDYYTGSKLYVDDIQLIY